MSNAMIALHQPAQWLFAVACLIVGSGCASNRIALDTDFCATGGTIICASCHRHLPELQSFVHNEKIAKRGDYSINVGAVQKGSLIVWPKAPSMLTSLPTRSRQRPTTAY